MLSRTLLGLGLKILAGVIVIATTSLAARGVRNARQGGVLQIPVVIEQMPADKGVGLHCGPARLSSPDTLESFSCAINNRTGGRIRSFSIIFTIVGERDGEELRSSRFTAYDMLIHPDFNNSPSDKTIPPGGEYTLGAAGPTTIADVVIKKVEVKIDHVELHGGVTLGANERGLSIVARRREGAAKFKQWIRQNYQGGGRSVNAIVPLIQQTPDSPAAIGLDEVGLEQGAEMYRMLLLKRYNAHGAAGLNKVLGN
jgi:hypothetical protein